MHDVIGTRCDPYTYRLLSGGTYHHCCHSNLTRALAAETGLPLAAAEAHVHDVLNVFMCTGFTADTGQYFMKASPVRVGDYLEFFAEIDLLGALSACPGGDCSSEHSSDVAKCYPLGSRSCGRLRARWRAGRRRCRIRMIGAMGSLTGRFGSFLAQVTGNASHRIASSPMSPMESPCRRVSPAGATAWFYASRSPSPTGCGMVEGGVVELSVDEGQLTVRPLPAELRLDAMLAGITPENLPVVFDDAPVGREAL